MPNASTPSISQLKRAVDLAERIKTLEAELAGILGNSAPAASPVTAGAKPGRRGRKKRSKITAEGLANIKAAQQARWARVRGLKGAAPAAEKAAPKNGRRKGRRTVSPAARERMAAAAKLRWSKIKKG